MLIGSTSNRLGPPFTNIWSKVACVIGVLALCVYQGDAIVCHQCLSVTDPKCGDPYDTNLKPLPCSLNMLDLLKGAKDFLDALANALESNPPEKADDNSPVTCYKAVIKPDSDDDKEMVLRGCCPSGDFNMCNALKSSNLSFCETCTTDGCNGASTFSPNSLLALLVVAVTALLVRL